MHFELCQNDQCEILATSSFFQIFEAAAEKKDAPLADTEPPDESSAKKLVPLVEEIFAEKIVNPVERCAKELEIEEAGNDQDEVLLNAMISRDAERAEKNKQAAAEKRANAKAAKAAAIAKSAAIAAAPPSDATAMWPMASAAAWPPAAWPSPVAKTPCKSVAGKAPASKAKLTPEKVGKVPQQTTIMKATSKFTAVKAKVKAHCKSVAAKAAASKAPGEVKKGPQPAIVSHEASRCQYLARTGGVGDTGSKVFPYGESSPMDHDTAHASAVKWLNDYLAAHGAM